MKNTNGERKVLSVQDISCLGQCSNTVMLPMLSAAGLETVVLPTALLSTHTGGFQGYTFLDLTGEMEKILAHYTQMCVRFDMLVTGYFGSAHQIGILRRMGLPLLKPGALRIIDPVLGDNGALYPIYTPAFVEQMRGLCSEADIITPNLTEACLLSDMAYEKAGAPGFYDALFARLHALGPHTVILTGIRFSEERIGILGEAGKTRFSADAPYVDCCFHGTGDVFTGALVGRIARGDSVETAAARAVNFVSECIADTMPVIEEHWYGLCFEERLNELTRGT